MKFEAPRGTQDVLPAQQPLWERVMRETEDVCAAYGYRRITTPLFEDTELFTRTSGEGSDVVQKEMYTFTDRGDRSLTLRPEGTASVARAYVEHGLFREAAAGEDVPDRPDVQVLRAAAREVSGVLAAQRRGDGLRRSCARR